MTVGATATSAGTNSRVPTPGAEAEGRVSEGAGEGGGGFGPLGPLGVRHAGGANGRRAQCAPPREPFKIRH